MYGLIMAGGSGKRFWPWSRDKCPKQFLPIVGEIPLLEKTFYRLKPLIDPSHIFVVTVKSQKKQIEKMLPEIPAENIIAEPMGKNTAPCIGLGAIMLRRHDPEAVQVVLPADHIITDEKEFRATLNTAADVARSKKCLVTIGIHPSRPETGYGYIQIDQKESGYKESVFHVKTFAEKPNLETAKLFLESGDFLWNSGIFVWKIEVILREIEKSLPELYQGLLEIEAHMGKPNLNKVIRRVYGTIKSISIDYGVMEKADDVCVVKADLGWSDVGSWEEVYRIMQHDDNHNTVNGNVAIYNASGNLLYSEKRLIAAVGVNDLIVVETRDAVLVCRRDQSQEVKEIVDYLKRKKMKKYL